MFQMASRREANWELSRPAFLATLQALFPELESLPHADTLAAAVAGDRGPGVGRGACGIATALDPQQEIPSLLDQPVLPDCHRWDAEVRESEINITPLLAVQLRHPTWEDSRSAESSVQPPTWLFCSSSPLFYRLSRLE